MKFSLSLIAVLAFVGLSFTGPEKPEVASYSVDTAESVINWRGYKVTGQHHGTVRIKSGELQYEGDQLTSGAFAIDMTTITVEDLEGEWKKKLEGHLKSDDFFGVEKYPAAIFEITEVISRGKPGDYRITGNLTIKESTNPIKFNALVTEEGGKRTATAEVTIDRSEYEVRYGSGSFFDNLGDKTIYDEFDLQIELVTGE
jgi:polyisoprenoid-binding protein YceI